MKHNNTECMQENLGLQEFIFLMFVAFMLTLSERFTEIEQKSSKY